ncbi:MAG: RhuM family protein [Minisyncoccota bacterium]
MNKKQRTDKQQLIIYQTKSGALELRKDAGNETMWATQAQIVELFDVDQSVVSRHIKNIFKDGEIEEKSNMQKMHNANSDKPIALYSLDVILSVGYRTNSKVAIGFRKWATKTLRKHIINGYTINRSRIAQNYGKFMRAVGDVRALLPAGSNVSNESILELIGLFSDTWLSLDAYDKEKLATKGATKRSVKLTADKIVEAIKLLKISFAEKGEDTNIFATERERGNLAGIVGNVMQVLSGGEVYPTLEEKAAHLFYFMVKDHPFVDGNKRIGAYVFIWFLRQAGILDIARITPSALTALTLLVAESDPRYKEKTIQLVLTLLVKNKKK